MSTIQKYNQYVLSLLVCLMFNCSTWAMELQNIELIDQSAVPTLKALCINAYLKNKRNISSTEIDRLNVPVAIKNLITLYGPLRKDTLDDQLRCFIELNDSKKIEEVLQYIPKKEVTSLEKIGDFSKGYIRIWSRAYKARMHVEKAYNTWARDAVKSINQNNISQTPNLQPIINQERSSYTEQRMKLFFCGRYSFWICCGGICLSSLGAVIIAAIALNPDPD